MKQVYILCDFGTPRAVFTYRENADNLADTLGTGFSVRALPIIDSDGTSVPIVPDDYKGGAWDDGGADA